MLFLSCDEDLLAIIKLVRRILWYISLLIPIILIAIGTFDMLKAITASKEDEIKSAQKVFIKRIISSVLIFLIVPIVNFVFGLFEETGIQAETGYTTNWIYCWNEAGTGSSSTPSFYDDAEYHLVFQCGHGISSCGLPEEGDTFTITQTGILGETFDIPSWEPVPTKDFIGWKVLGTDTVYCREGSDLCDNHKVRIAMHADGEKPGGTLTLVAQWAEGSNNYHSTHTFDEYIVRFSCGTMTKCGPNHDQQEYVMTSDKSEIIIPDWEPISDIGLDFSYWNVRIKALDSHPRSGHGFYCKKSRVEDSSDTSCEEYSFIINEGNEAVLTPVWVGKSPEYSLIFSCGTEGPKCGLPSDDETYTVTKKAYRRFYMPEWEPTSATKEFIGWQILPQVQDDPNALYCNQKTTTCFSNSYVIPNNGDNIAHATAMWKDKD